MSGHEIRKCAEHDRLISQCRCPGEKTLVRVACPYPKEHARLEAKRG